MSSHPPYYEAFKIERLSLPEEDFMSFTVEQRINRLFEYFDSLYFVPDKPKEGTFVLRKPKNKQKANRQ